MSKESKIDIGVFHGRRNTAISEDENGDVLVIKIGESELWVLDRGQPNSVAPGEKVKVSTIIEKIGKGQKVTYTIEPAGALKQ